MSVCLRVIMTPIFTIHSNHCEYVLISIKKLYFFHFTSNSFIAHSASSSFVHLRLKTFNSSLEEFRFYNLDFSVFIFFVAISSLSVVNESTLLPLKEKKILIKTVSRPQSSMFDPVKSE